jgi:hypothetical protein
VDIVELFGSGRFEVVEMSMVKLQVLYVRVWQELIVSTIHFHLHLPDPCYISLSSGLSIAESSRRVDVAPDRNPFLSRFRVPFVESSDLTRA